MLCAHKQQYACKIKEENYMDWKLQTAEQVAILI